MEIWFKGDDARFQLPVNPTELKTQSSNSNTTILINSTGEKNLLGHENLRILPISSFFPAQNYDFLQCVPWKDPHNYIRKIENWKGRNVPILVTVTGTTINEEYSIESIEYGTQDGTGDIYYDLELKEYKMDGIERAMRKVVSSTKEILIATTQRKNTKKPKTTTYIVKKGDTLSSIAKKITGSSNNARAIAKQNNITNMQVKTGQKLVIKI